MNRQQLVVKGRGLVEHVRTRPRFFLLAAAALALLLWVFMSSSDVSERADRLGRVVESQQVLIDKLAVALDEARAQGAAVPAPEVIAADVPDAEVSPAIGVQGERGDAGAPGIAGAAGEPGIGIAGSQGEKGEKGDTVVGPAGPAGIGETGAQGAPGIGVAGADGQSIVGPAGADGQPGQNGADGAPGADSQVPGPPGADSQVPGPQGPPPSSWTFSIGPVNYLCSPTPADPAVFTCAVVP